MRYRLFYLFVLICTLIYSQKQDRNQFIQDSLKIMKGMLVRPQFKFDNRVTWYEGQALVINGLDAGALLKDKMRLTLGYYSLNHDLNAFKKKSDSMELGGQVRVNYGSINTEFIYKNTRYFSLGMPLEIGVGQIELNYKNFTLDRIYQKQKGFLAMAYFGLSATFKPIRWIGLKGIVGYRKNIFTQVKEFNFDGLFTSLGLNIDFQEIIRDFRMFRLKKKYKRGNNISNAVDLITD
jgi:hypothetical protein